MATTARTRVLLTVAAGLLVAGLAGPTLLWHRAQAGSSSYAVAGPVLLVADPVHPGRLHLQPGPGAGPAASDVPELSLGAPSLPGSVAASALAGATVVAGAVLVAGIGAGVGGRPPRPA